MAALLALKQPLPLQDAHEASARYLEESLRAASSQGDGSLVESLLASALAEHEELQSRLSASQRDLDDLVANAQTSLDALQRRADDLHASHLQAEDDLIDQRNALTPPDGAKPSLLQELESLEKHLVELETTRAYFSVLEQAEEQAQAAIQGLDSGSTDAALRSYTQLVAFSRKVSAAKGKNGESLNAAALVSSMAYETFQALRIKLSAKLHVALDKAKWPSTQQDELAEQDVASAIRLPFLDLLKLQKTANDHVLPELADLKSAPLLAVAALAQPIVLRFRFHFEGQRQTNRLDKPEWFFAHVLNASADQERFLTNEVQHLLKQGGFAQVDGFIDFVTVLTEVITRKLRHTTPQLLSMPPILAHTIYQALEFDDALKKKYGYAPRGQQGQWPGTVEAILGRQDWLDQWRAAEKKHADDRYYEIIGASDAWQINEDVDPAGSLKPTNSSLRIRDLFDQLTDRYRSLPLFAHRLPFLLDIQLPLLELYHQRIASAIDAFETLSFGLMRAVPGALGDSAQSRLTAGVAGLQRVVRAGVSARWMETVCKAWADETFFVEMWSDIRDKASQDELAREAIKLLGSQSSTLFASQCAHFASLAERIDALIVKHIVRETSNELKGYFNKRWDQTASGEKDDMSLSPELLSALSTFSTLVSSLSSSLPVLPLQQLYRQVAQHLAADWLLPRVATSKVFSQPGGEQFRFDFEQGWVTAGRRAGVRQPLAGFQKLRDAVILLSLPAGPEGELSKVSQAVWDDDNGSRYDDMMAKIEVQTMSRKEVQATLRKRSEVWR